MMYTIWLLFALHSDPSISAGGVMWGFESRAKCERHISRLQTGWIASCRPITVIK